MTGPATLALNGVVADFASETVLDGAGQPVPLRPQAFAVLRRLAAEPGRLVTKDELMDAVWPGIAVTDDSLVQAVHDVRRALGDDAHRVVRTVPRRGYRLVLPDETPAATAGPPGRRRPWGGRGLAAAGAAVVVAGAALAWWLGARPEPVAAAVDGPPVVAVVPFVNVAGDEASQLFSIGCGYFFMTDFARYREFLVVGRSATYVHADKPAGGLDVDFVLGGAIHREADRLRVTAELTDARTGTLLWSERWDRPDRDLLAYQAEISEQISNRLGGATGLIQEAGRAVAHRKRPGDLTGYELYLLATDKLARDTRADTVEAVALLDRAVALDPGFARALAELSLAHTTLADFGVDPADNRRLAVEIAERAVAGDAGDAWTHAARGAALRYRGDFVHAGSALDTALALAPNAAEVLSLYASSAATSGQPELGAAMADRVARLDPDFPPRAARRFAEAYFMAGRYRAALAMIDRLPAESRTPALRVMQAGSLAAVGRPEAAQAVEAMPDASIEAMANAPGYGSAEHRRLVETMRLAGFPACGPPAALAQFGARVRLPECAPNTVVSAP